MRQKTVVWLIAIALLLGLASPSFAQGTLGVIPDFNWDLLTLSQSHKVPEVGDLFVVRARVNQTIDRPVMMIWNTQYQDGAFIEHKTGIATWLCDNGYCATGIDAGQEVIAYQTMIEKDTRKGSYQVSISAFLPINPIGHGIGQGTLRYDIGHPTFPYKGYLGIESVTNLGQHIFGGTVVRIDGTFPLFPFKVVLRNAEGATQFLTATSFDGGKSATFVVPKDQTSPGVPYDVVAIFGDWLIQSCAPKAITPPL